MNLKGERGHLGAGVRRGKGGNYANTMSIDEILKKEPFNFNFKNTPEIKRLFRRRQESYINVVAVTMVPYQLITR